MTWLERLGKDNRGSRPRCVLLTDGSREDVAARLTQLVNLSDVLVCPSDKWMPSGKESVEEVELDKQNILISPDVQWQLQEWWIAVRGKGRGARTPNWDIASTCKIEGKPGLLLIEAKAHESELKKRDRSRSRPPNNGQIMQAIDEARTDLQAVIGGNWDISRDHHYELSNRFAWSWKLVSLGIPVVLLYLGFLDTEDMLGDGPLFRSEEDWEQAVKNYCHGIVPETCWEQRWDFGGVPLIPLIRAFNQQLDRA